MEPTVADLSREIERLRLEQLIERAAIARVLEAWERIAPIERVYLPRSLTGLIEAIEGLRADGAEGADMSEERASA